MELCAEAASYPLTALNMLVLCAKTEAEWILVHAPLLSESLFFRHLKIRSKCLFTACKLRFFGYFCLVMQHDSTFAFFIFSLLYPAKDGLCKALIINLFIFPLGFANESPFSRPVSIG